MEDTAVPFPYAKIIDLGCNDRPMWRWRRRQCRFPTPKLSIGRSDVTITRFVGTRHCRLLILGNA
ncbi:MULTISPECIES: hypothetical protein [unclassified Microcoleus]|uniref:hypothetical protein n=1 Tax=unclassified Microcoleus TaxID=2642155 RepID=UPI002FD675A6